ncbi:MAG: phosphoribosylformylglycinamidine synthase subunit PurL [Limisphaerales bacterium]|jgi:phosphoribosylformylglycinamidine synthase II|nr:phosphoribosylformylglycinamidine synthase subunit PurL [Verrucomicrobiota bacterium]
MTKEPAVTAELVEKHGISPQEYEQILQILGREPNYVELGIFSVMWSEHCSYKNTKPLLKQFPTSSDKILVKAGEENAGIIDIGDNLAIAFKIESHNHPSAIDPFMGAATGVGGVVRDIFTMGARPICALNSLRFGNLSSESAQELLRGAVEGIAYYGNTLGVPTVGGEIYFDECYEGNPLVNAFCMGVLRHGQIARGAAKGIGNPVFYVGAPTGREGLAGAAFASQDLTEESASRQSEFSLTADPLLEKQLIEACLELLATPGAVAGIQDMGAAGLTCSTCETAARAGTGIEIELTKVPQRLPDMTPYEILLSESQERMLIIVNKGHEAEVQRIFDKWNVPWAQVGFVTDTGRMVVKNQGQTVADIPAAKIANDSPVYHRDSKEPAYLEEVRAFRVEGGIPDTANPQKELEALLQEPSIASKNWAYQQFDYKALNSTVVIPGSDAAVLEIKHENLPMLSAETPETVPAEIEKYLALAVDGNGVYVYLDPYEGSKTVVAECARNLACSGATPLGSTDNLNFGNPHNPELFYQLKESVRGLAEACRAFDAPVTGGNVSLYNQTPKGAIDPTPTVALVGLIEKKEHITTQWFKDEGDAIILLGAAVDEADPNLGLGGSAYLLSKHQTKNGMPPRCDLQKEKALQAVTLDCIRSGWVKSAHDCSEGGLAVTLAESCFNNFNKCETKGTPAFKGAKINLSAINCPRLDALLFGETQSRILISVAPGNVAAVLAKAEAAGVPAAVIGEVNGCCSEAQLEITTGTGSTWSWSVPALHELWWNALAKIMNQQ